MVNNLATEYVLLDVAKREIVKRIPVATFGSNAAWSGDGSMFAIFRDRKNISLFDAETLSELVRIRAPVQQQSVGDEGDVSVCFHPDGNAIFAHLNKDQIHRWDIKQMRENLSELGLDW